MAVDKEILDNITIEEDIALSKLADKRLDKTQRFLGYFVIARRCVASTCQPSKNDYGLPCSL